MAEKKKDLKTILTEFLAPGIEGTKWPNVTHLFLIVKAKDGNVIYHKYYNSNGAHTESKMLRDKEFVKIVKTGDVNITLNSNYSPCATCASKLEEFYVQNKNSIEKFTIKFSFLYKKRESDNQAGLKKLNTAGITLEAMTEKYWFEVFVASVFDVNKADKVRERDSNTKRALSKLLTEGPGAGQQASATEDRGIEEVAQRLGALNVTQETSENELESDSL